MSDIPIYHEGRYRLGSWFGTLEEQFRRFPLDEKFINWVAEQGFKIVYDFSWKEGAGNVWWSLRQIMVSPCGEDALVKLTLIHELIHIAIGAPGNIGRKYEELIDQIAKEYVKNLEFINYIGKKIPALTQNKGL